VPQKDDVLRHFTGSIARYRAINANPTDQLVDLLEYQLIIAEGGNSNAKPEENASREVMFVTVTMIAVIILTKPTVEEVHEQHSEPLDQLLLVKKQHERGTTVTTRATEDAAMMPSVKVMEVVLCAQGLRACVQSEASRRPKLCNVEQVHEQHSEPHDQLLLVKKQRERGTTVTTRVTEDAAMMPSVEVMWYAQGLRACVRLEASRRPKLCNVEQELTNSEGSVPTPVPMALHPSQTEGIARISQEAVEFTFLEQPTMMKTQRIAS